MKAGQRYIFLLALFFSCLLLLEVGCPPPREAVAPPVTVKVLATTDVHGWLNAKLHRSSMRYEGGLSELTHALRKNEGLELTLGGERPQRDFLLLDSGDMWTGPPESSLLKGAPVVEIYNRLGYDAGLLGNHEFDFGLELLQSHVKELHFPLLAANIDARPESGLEPFWSRGVVANIQGLKIGIIGLALKSTPVVTFPSNVEGLDFGEYLPALRREAQRLQAQGAEFLIVLGHMGIEEFKPVAEKTADLPIRLFLGGHVHERQLEVLERDPGTAADDLILLTAGCYAQGYGRIELTFKQGTLQIHNERIVPIEGAIEGRGQDPIITQIVDKANREVRPRLQEVLGRARESIAVGTVDDSPMGRLLTDSWLEQFPQAELAITNIGGLRQELEAGPVSILDILGVLPFMNDVVLVRLTPAQIRAALTDSTMLVGGLRYGYRLEGDRRVVTRLEDLTGHPLQESRRYVVATTDFLYAGGDGMPFKKMDPHPELLGVNWREPLIRKFRLQGEAGVTAPPMARAIAEASLEPPPSLPTSASTRPYSRPDLGSTHRTASP